MDQHVIDAERMSEHCKNAEGEYDRRDKQSRAQRSLQNALRIAQREVDAGDRAEDDAGENDGDAAEN